MSQFCCDTRCQGNVREREKKRWLFSNLFVYFSASSFVAFIKPLAWDDSAWQPPPSLPHTFPLAIRNYHTVRVLACPKATAGLIFLAWLLSDMPGKGKERKWVDQPLSFPQSRPGRSQPSVFRLGRACKGAQPIWF